MSLSGMTDGLPEDDTVIVGLDPTIYIYEKISFSYIFVIYFLIFGGTGAALYWHWQSGLF